ncbi:MAG: hypothetical protein AAF974_02275 [Cyanobacteria bacterium P01_E01_bin.34]
MTFLEVDLPLEAIRPRLTIEVTRQSSSVTPAEATLEPCFDWERLVLKTVRQQLPEGKLLRWAITSVCVPECVAKLEVVATL